MLRHINRSQFGSLLLLLLILFGGCGEGEPQTASEVIDRSIQAYGGDALYRSDISFDFREFRIRAFYDNGMYSWERKFEHDSLGSVHDVLTNDGFKRTANAQAIELDEEWTGKYSRSVNAIVYFFRLPFNLRDPAVNYELLPETELGDQVYYKVFVTFDEEGGGDDYDDSFVYWINKETFFIDYLAYSYSTDGGGKRFREAINPRTINGLRVVDYINYEPSDESVDIVEYDRYFEDGDGLKELSRIENRNIEVAYLE